MQNKNNITSRSGSFTSSQIFRLMGSDAVRKTYIEKKKMEHRLGRQLEQEKGSAASLWGTWMQHRVTNVLLGMDCVPTKNIRRTNLVIPNHTGAEDYLKIDCIGEIKCYELENFCKAHDAATAGWDTLKKVCPNIAWQLVSNAILNDKQKAELTLYVPYQKELSIIRDKDEWERILSLEDFENKEFQYWINRIGLANDDELPYLIEGYFYKNVSSFIFEIPESDKTALTNQIIIASSKI